MDRRGVLIMGIVLVLSGGGTAAAHHNGHEFGSFDECVESGTVHRMPTCSQSGDGPWVARYPGGFGEGPSFPIGGFLMLALLWAAAPAAIGGFVAADRGQSVGLAILLGIFLGWIGLLIVVVAFKPEVATATRSVLDRATGPPPPARRDARSRLEDLERLREGGLITDEEYASRRTAILEDI